MKKKELKKTLSLSKETISELNNEKLNKIVGGRRWRRTFICGETCKNPALTMCL